MQLANELNSIPHQGGGGSKIIENSCTGVRIPTSRAHSENIVTIFDKPVNVALPRTALEEAPGR